MASDSLIKVEHGGNLAFITLNRPTVGNAINGAMAERFLQEVVSVAEDSTIRCVILTGAGTKFCVGGDVSAFSEGNAAAAVSQITAPLHAAINRLATMAKPLVVGVNGAAAGAGFGLAMLGDIVLAGKSSHFTAAYTSIGMSPDAATSWLLPRIAGLRIAQEIILTNRRVEADEARSIGLVTRVAEDDRLSAELVAQAQALAKGAPFAQGQSRRLLNASFNRSLAEQLELEAAAIALCAASEDGREGVSSFTERRKAVFDRASGIAS